MEMETLGLVAVTVVMVTSGFWPVKFWPKTFLVVILFLLAVFLGFEKEVWGSFWEFIWEKFLLLPLLGFFSTAILVCVINKEKELLDDSVEGDDAYFVWFLLALASSIISLITMIVLFYRFELKWFIWLPILVTYVVPAALSLYHMNSDKRKKMIITALSLYFTAVVGLTLIILS